MKRNASAILKFMVLVFIVIAIGLFILHQLEQRAGGNIVGRTAGAVERAVTPGAGVASVAA